MLNRTDISTFSLDILRRDKRHTFSRDFTEGDAFQQLCYDLLTQEFKEKGVRLTLYPTKARNGGVDISGEDSNHNKIIIECNAGTGENFSRGDAETRRRGGCYFFFLLRVLCVSACKRVKNKEENKWTVHCLSIFSS